MTRTLFFILFCFINATTAAQEHTNLTTEEWPLFKRQFLKRYNVINERLRRHIYLINKERIERHNERFHKGQVSHELAMNQFGDMLNSEFTKTRNGYKHGRMRRAEDRNQSLLFTAPLITLPKECDWRKRGAVSEVKDQGQCGSCWAFSAVGSLEGQHFRKTTKLVPLSKQNLIDCSSDFGNYGCNGGLVDTAFQYIKYNKGINTEDSYPYEGVDSKCRYNPKNSRVTVKNYVIIPKDEEKLKLAVATIGPISIAIDASPPDFQFYKSGIYYNERCKSQIENLNHALLLVGYGNEDGKDYWLVKNSWGKSWGSQGYIKIARNRNNHCGIATYAIYPSI